jgi:hypothetical protein
MNLTLWGNHYKVLLGRVFLNWRTNESYRSWIFDSICTVQFSNVIINILLLNLKLKIQNSFKFTYKQNTEVRG